MKKILFISLAILFVMSRIAIAANIPTDVDPKSYPEVWTQQVYNGSGSSIVSAYIVMWDFETSDSAAGDGTWYDDMCSWVTLCTSASGVWTAGVVPFGNDIANGDTGAIIIKGPAYVKEYLTTPPTADQLCGSHTDGSVTADTGSGNTAALGICIDASPEGGPLGLGSFDVIYVDVTTESD